jgi:myo-inositol-1(or 4)-monophosphatase
MFLAAEGLGATCNGKPIAVSNTASLDRSSLGLGHNQRVAVDDFSDDMARLLATGASFRQVGAGALMLAYVAAGRVDCYFERHMWPWDAVAGLALILAGGGLVTTYPPKGVAVARRTGAGERPRTFRTLPRGDRARAALSKFGGRV